MAERKPKATVVSNGCISNLVDGTDYERILEGAGYELTADMSTAELVIVNTCAFDCGKEESSLELIHACRQCMRPGAELIVGGCLPSINSDCLAEAHQGRSFGPQSRDDLFDMLPPCDQPPEPFDGPVAYSQYSPLKKGIYHARRVIDSVPILSRIPLVRRLLTPLFLYSKNVYCLPVVTGCCGTCSFCAIRFAKGWVDSRPVDHILNKVDEALNQGYNQFVLVGDEISAYGMDLGQSQTILDVSVAILKRERIKRLYLESFEPSFMIEHFDRLASLLSEGKTPVFCSSVQSGSDRILKRMRRRYRAIDYLRCMQQIRRRFPYIYLRTEFIVGFPGETEDDFGMTQNLLRNLNADFVDIYEYTDRPNTEASRMPDKIPERIKRRRRRALWWQHLANLFLRGRRVHHLHKPCRSKPL